MEKGTRAADEGLRSHRVAHQVIPIERDVQRPGGDVLTVDFLQRTGEASGNRHPPCADA